MKSYTLTRSEPDPNSCRSPETFYYVDGKRASNHEYSKLWLIGHKGKTDCHVTRRSSRGRWLHSLCVYA